MKTAKSIFLIGICLLILAQIPFIYLRFQKGKLAAKIAALNEERTEFNDPEYQELKGAVHVHTAIGGHSTGTFDELLEGAQKNGLDFVVLTEHASAFFDTSKMTLTGFNEGVLFIGGNELDTENQDRFLVIPGSPNAEEMTRESNEEFLGIVHSQGKLALMAYPEKFKNWDSDFDGIEIFNTSTNLKSINIPYFLFDVIWSYGSYPELTLAGYLKRPDENLRKFDEVSAKRRISVSGGTDAHSNIGFHFLGDDAGNKLINLKLDGYEIAFRMLRTHLLIDKTQLLSEESVLDALEKGHSFIGFDVLSDSTGFSFRAENGSDHRLMGDEISFAENNTFLTIKTPQTARFVIFRNGEIVSETAQIKELRLPVEKKGTYRVEVYLDSLGSPFDKFPWIISNPIYIN